MQSQQFCFRNKMKVAVEPLNSLILPASIQYFSVLVDGHLSNGFDALRDLRDTRLALLCLICKLKTKQNKTKQNKNTERKKIKKYVVSGPALEPPSFWLTVRAPYYCATKPTLEVCIKISLLNPLRVTSRIFPRFFEHFKPGSHMRCKCKRKCKYKRKRCSHVQRKRKEGKIRRRSPFLLPRWRTRVKLWPQ